MLTVCRWDDILERPQEVSDEARQKGGLWPVFGRHMRRVRHRRLRILPEQS